MTAIQGKIIMVGLNRAIAAVLRSIQVTVIAVIAVATNAAAAPSPEDIWKRTLDLYAGLTSYSDTGTVLFEAPGISETHRFTTRYQSPRTLYFDFVKVENVDRFVIWSDAEAFHTWWMTTGLEEAYPKGSGIMAFSQADYLTNGSAIKLLPLIFSQSGLQGTFTNFRDLTLDGTEKIDNHICFRLVGRTSELYTATGREVNIRKLTVWIDGNSLLIRKIFEDTPKGIPIKQYLHRTTTFEPLANPQLDASSFQFTAPAGN